MPFNARFERCKQQCRVFRNRRVASFTRLFLELELLGWVPIEMCIIAKEAFSEQYILKYLHVRLYGFWNEYGICDVR